jgi:NCS1 family nucleobase:cation symporter-1
VGTVVDRPRDEAPYTLDEPAPRVLSFWDQSAFWANLGVSLLAFSGAVTVLAPDAAGVPQLPILAGIVAMIVGTVIGGIMLGLAAVPGTRAGVPAMMLLRGLFGTRLSYVPTVLNILQMIGWGTFELIVIADAAEQLFGGGPHWAYASRCPTSATGRGAISGSARTPRWPCRSPGCRWPPTTRGIRSPSAPRSARPASRTA